VRKGLSHGAAIERIWNARGVAVPETEEQREWIDHFCGRNFEMNQTPRRQEQ
jgi:hypothetical protein